MIPAPRAPIRRASIGTGPFKFQEWRQGESVTLVRNDDYYGKVPYIDTYTLRIWPDQTAVVNALLNGEIDAAGLEPADIAAVEGTPGITVVHYPTRSFTYYEFNLDPEVTTKWQDKRVRQALLYALDRESIVNDILLGYAEVAQGTQPVISYAYAPDEITTKYTYDPEKAKALLAEAGWTDYERRWHRRQRRGGALLRAPLRLRLSDERPNRRLHAGCLGRDRRRGDAALPRIPGTDRGHDDRSQLRDRARMGSVWDANIHPGRYVWLRPVPGRVQ